MISASPAIPPARGAIGLVFDERFQLHGAPEGHPERPARLAAIEARLAADGLVSRCRRVPARDATREELLAVHTPEHVARIEASAGRPFTRFDPDTTATAESAAAANLAAGGVIDLTKAVLGGELRSGLALVRPPGHHAEADRAMGFCLFNNVAVAAKAAQIDFAARAAQTDFAARAAQTARAVRVLIVDWDVHHGNGSQNTFWDDPSVLYFSTHQWPLYPGTGAVEETGGPKAPGRNINVPLPPGMGDAEYFSAFDRVLMPAARAFAPDLVLVSAGFDAAAGDLLGAMRISPAGYAGLTERLLPLAGGKLVLVLEGGYDLDAISASTAACVRVLLGEPAPASDAGAASPRAERVLDMVIDAHRPFWPGVFGEPGAATSRPTSTGSPA